MHRVIRPAVAALILGGLLSNCAQRDETPPPPAPTPTPMYPKTAYITLFEYPIANGCGVVALPYHAWVAKDGDIVWDVVDDACSKSGELKIEFAEANVVDLDQGSLQTKKKKGKVKAQDYKPHKYSVSLGTFKHDPEIEIWP